jgi:hypothetical protein
MLEVGIESEEGRQMFSEEENEFLHSFAMGTIAMAAGIGRIADQNRRSVWVEEATFRFQMAARKVLKDNADGAPFTQEFVQRMADAGWSANVTLEPFEMWALKHIKPSWSGNRFTRRMITVVENAYESMEKMERMVSRIVTDPRVRGRDLHHLIPDHMFDMDINEDGNVLHWDFDREQAYFVPINKEEEE